MIDFADWLAMIAVKPKTWIIIGVIVLTLNLLATFAEVRRYLRWKRKKERE